MNNCILIIVASHVYVYFVYLVWSPDMGPVHPRPLASGYQQLVGVDTHAADVLGVA